MSLSDKLFDRLILPLLGRREVESLFLRAEFKRRYDIEVGLYSYGCFDRWRIPRGTWIGRYCSFAKSSRLIDANHPLDNLSTHPFLYDVHFDVIGESQVRKTQILVEDDVWIGHNAIVTPSVRVLSRGCIVGAGSVVTTDVPRYAIVAGTPAELIRYRFPAETRQALDASEWWKLDRSNLKQFLQHSPLVEARSGRVVSHFVNATSAAESSEGKVGPGLPVDRPVTA